MPSTSASLAGLASELLAAAAAALAPDPPAVQFVSIDNPPYDGCELLTVHVPLLATVQGMHSRAGTGPLQSRQEELYGSMNEVSFLITIMRCISTARGGGSITVPQASTMDTEAQQRLTDAWRLWNGLRSKYRHGTLWQPYPVRNVTFGPVYPIAPGGGGAGSTMACTVNLDGYDAP